MQLFVPFFDLHNSYVIPGIYRLFTLYYHVNSLYLQYFHSPIISNAIYYHTYIIAIHMSFLQMVQYCLILGFCMVQFTLLMYHDHGFIFGAMLIVY